MVDAADLVRAELWCVREHLVFQTRERFLAELVRLGQRHSSATDHHPEPAPFVYCYACSRIRSIIAYQRIGWLEPKPKPAKPKPSPRTAMERRLKKLELEAADLRERLRNLPGAD